MDWRRLSRFWVSFNRDIRLSLSCPWGYLFAFVIEFPRNLIFVTYDTSRVVDLEHEALSLFSLLPSYCTPYPLTALPLFYVSFRSVENFE